MSSSRMTIDTIVVNVKSRQKNEDRNDWWVLSEILCRKGTLLSIFSSKELGYAKKLVFLISAFQFSSRYNERSIHSARTSFHRLTRWFFFVHMVDKWPMLPKSDWTNMMEEEINIDESHPETLLDLFGPDCIPISMHRCRAIIKTDRFIRAGAGIRIWTGFFRLIGIVAMGKSFESVLR